MAQKITYELLKKIVWNFADLLRDKGKGSVEDYARITIPTLALKRILDLKDEFLERSIQGDKVALEMGLLDINVALKNINSKEYHFYDESLLINNPNKFNVILLSWSHLMNYEENPNKESRIIQLSYNQAYTTNAKNFTEIIFEIVETFNKLLKQVFNSFDYQTLLIQKEVVKYSDFYKICHNTVLVNGKDEKHEYSQYSLNNFQFDDDHVDSDIFGDVYMDLVGRFAEDAGKKGGEFFTPTPLVENGIKFLDLKDFVLKMKNGEKTVLNIGDPTSGSNTFLMYAKKELETQANILGFVIPKDNIQFYGQELKSFQASLGALNMVFHGLANQYNKGILLEHQVSSVIDNYFNGIGTKRGELDLVLANPPYGTKDYGEQYAIDNKNVDQRWKYGVPKKSDGEYGFLLTIIDLLNKNGRGLVVMPLGTLFRDSSAAIRKHLLQEDIIEGLITLPANMFLTTSIPVVLWVLNKDKKEADKNKVFMINASKDFKKVGKFNEWQTEKAIQTYLNREEEVDYAGYVDFATLEKNKFNLSVQRYFSKEKEKEIIDILKLEREILELEDKINTDKSDIQFIMNQILELESVNPIDEIIFMYSENNGKI